MKLFSFNLKLHDIVDNIDRLSDFEFALIDLELVIFKAGDVQCIVDHVLQVDGAIVHYLKELEDLGNVETMAVTFDYKVKDNLEDRYYRVQGCSELMSDRREEVSSHHLTLLLQLNDAGDVCTDNQQLSTIIDHASLHLNIAQGAFRLENRLRFSRGLILTNGEDVIPEVLPWALVR